MPLDPANGSAMVVFIIFAKSFYDRYCSRYDIIPYFVRSRTEKKYVSRKISMIDTHILWRDG